MTIEKRGLDSDDSEEGQSSKKRQALSSVNVESFQENSLQQLLTSLAPIICTELRSSFVSVIRAELHSSLPPIIRKIVSEEVQHALAEQSPARSGRSSPKRNEGPDGRNLQLHFRTRLSLPLFTEGKVEGEKGAAVLVALLNRNINDVVTSGPESSAKLDVVVLEGDFNNEDDDNWSQEEFKSHVVKEREGKRPLLTGDLQVTLKEGIGTLGDITFTDNSSWTRSKKFRLGLKLASGYCENLRIREAKTDAFIVKERRGELYKKHHPPVFNDEVWRLEKIGKDGSFHKRLNKNGIYTVEDFLRLLNRNSTGLQNILGSGMSSKTWDVLIEHAKTCVLSGKLYVFYDDDTKNVGVVLNSICELTALIAGGQYYRADSLSNSQKVYVDTLVKKAYGDWTQVIEYDGKALMSFEQTKQPSASLSEVPFCRQDCPTSFDQQGSLPSLPVPVPQFQPSVDSGLIVGGYNDDSGTCFFMDSHQVNSNANMQFDGSIAPQNQLSSASHQAQTTSNDTRLGLALDPLQAPSSVFQTVGPSIEASNLITSYSYGFSTEEEIHIRGQEIIQREDVQRLQLLFSMGNHNSVNPTEDVHLDSSGVPFPSTNFLWDTEDHISFSTINHRWDEEDHISFSTINHSWDEEDHNPLPTTNFSYNENYHNRSDNREKWWQVFFTIMRWRFTIKRIVAKCKSRANLVQLNE